MSGDLIVMAALIGVSRAIFGRKKQGDVERAVQSVKDSGTRGRSADKPSEIPAKGWKDIAWRVYDSFQNDRVLPVSAGVTFYALLALFPATAAIVSLYALFAEPSTINEHLPLISGFLPEGALTVIGDQVKRIASRGEATLGITFLGTLALSLWGLILLCHKLRRERPFVFAPQHGQRERMATSFAMSRRRMVAIELGT